jgi:hypothetical protein
MVLAARQLEDLEVGNRGSTLSTIHPCSHRFYPHVQQMTTSTSLVQPLIRPTKETARTMLDVLHYLGPFIPAFVG